MSDARTNELIKIIQDWLKRKKVGSLTLNFFKGGITSIRKEETIKLKDK